MRRGYFFVREKMFLQPRKKASLKGDSESHNHKEEDAGKEKVFYGGREE